MTYKPPSFDNFFALFEQPIGFDMDMALLHTRLRQLQQHFHPDKLNGDTAADGTHLQQHSAAQPNSALINHAYHILSNPDSRATYLLELAGQALDTNATISDLDFLDDAMDLRIRLEEATAAADLVLIQTLKTTVAARLNDFSARFQTAYRAQDWAAAIDTTQKLKFLVKLDKDISRAIDSLDTHDDDDLYV